MRFQPNNNSPNDWSIRSSNRCKRLVRNAYPAQIITTPLPQPQIIAPITEICAGETATQLFTAYPFVQWYLNDQLILRQLLQLSKCFVAAHHTRFFGVTIWMICSLQSISAIHLQPTPRNRILVCGNDQLPNTLGIAETNYTWHKWQVAAIRWAIPLYHQAYDDAEFIPQKQPTPMAVKGITGDAAK